MTVSGRIIRKKAVIITPDRLQELCDLLGRYSNRLTFEAETYSDTDITFETLDELLNYDNYKPRRIKELEITAYEGYDRVVTIYIGRDSYFFHFFNYEETIYCSYHFDSIDTEVVFKNGFNTWFEKAKGGYWLFGKFSFWGAIAVPSMLITFLRISIGYTTPVESLSGTFFILVILGALSAWGVIYLAKFIDKHIMGNLFPSVVFLWGEEIHRFNKWSKLRSNLLWGVIIAVLVGVVTGYLVDTLKMI